MKTRSALARRVAFCLAIATASATADPRAALDGVRQLVVVLAPSWDANTGTMLRFERRDDTKPFKRVGAKAAVTLGRSGLAWGCGLVEMLAGDGEKTKREGDGRSPAGVFPLLRAFGRARAVTTGLSYVRLDAHSRCVDDPASKSYDSIVDSRRVKADYSSYEPMATYYRLGVEVGHNLPLRVHGAGSCIFLHPWTKAGATTSGCTAMADEALDELVHCSTAQSGRCSSSCQRRSTPTCARACRYRKWRTSR